MSTAAAAEEEEEGNVPLALCAISIAVILSFQIILSTGHRPAKPSDHVARDRSDLHLPRKLHHLITGSLIYVASRFLGRGPGATVLLSFALLCYGCHALRKQSNAFDAAYLKRFRRLMRPHEVANATLPGAYYFLLGSGCSLVLFQLRIARLALLHVRLSNALTYSGAWQDQRHVQFYVWDCPNAAIAFALCCCCCCCCCCCFRCPLETLLQRSLERCAVDTNG